MWSILTFGKHKGKSLPRILLSDPDWFFWAAEGDVFRGRLAEEASLLEYRGCNIKIPKPNPQDWCVRYYTDRNGRFAGFDLIELATNPLQLDSIEMWREDRLDLSVPRRFKSYDKLGSRLLIRQFKEYFFDRKVTRLTKQKCEAFFSDKSNFILPTGRRPQSVDRDKEPNNWETILAAHREGGRGEVEEESSLSALFEVDDSGERPKSFFANPEYFPVSYPIIYTDGAISKQAWLDEMSELLGQMEQTEGEEKEEEISEEEWLAQMKQEEELYRAKERTRLEEEAEYSGVASERLRTLIEKEEEQKALAACAEDERRRQAIKAEAEESPLNWLFPKTDS